MTGDDASNITLLIGRLQGDVAALIRQWGMQDRAANDGRVALHQEVGQLRSDVVRLTEQVGEMKTDISEIKPFMQEARDRHQQGIGSTKAIAIVWSVIVAVISTTAVVIVEMLKHWWTAKP